MNKEFVPYELALELKELGFNEPCFGYFTKYEEFFYFDVDDLSTAYTKNMDNLVVSSVDELKCSAPTYSQAFRWFREQHGLQNIIWSGKISTVFYGYNILNIEEQEFIVNNSKNGGGECDYDTYEEAEFECLKQLIEIVKEKQNGRNS